MSNDGFFVYIVKSDGTASLGTGDLGVDGNGFVQKTQVSGIVKIPSVIQGYTLTSLSTYSFRNCNLITKLILSDTIVTLETASITCMSGITELVIPSSVAYLRDRIDVFENLKVLVFENKGRIRSIGSYFLQKSCEIEEIYIPDSVTSIGEYFCYNCSKLKHVHFCGIQDLSSISNALNDCPLYENTIVSTEYTGSSFGRKQIIKKLYSQCITKFDKCLSYSKIRHNCFNLLFSVVVMLFI